MIVRTFKPGGIVGAGLAFYYYEKKEGAAASPLPSVFLCSLCSRVFFIFVFINPNPFGKTIYKFLKGN